MESSIEENNFFQQKISSGLGLMFILVFALGVTLYFLNMADGIIREIENSPVINIQLRLKKNNITMPSEMKQVPRRSHPQSNP